MHETSLDAIIELDRILLIHGGTKQLPHLIRIIQAEGFIVTVERIPTEMPIDHDGIIFAGGTIPADNYQKVRFWSKHFIRNLTIPFLGICLGHMMLGLAYGATYRTMPSAEYGSTLIDLDGFPLAPRINNLKVWEDHTHEIIHLSSQLRNYASSQTTRIQAIIHSERQQFGVQFHPESEKETDGFIVLKNFLELVSSSARKGYHC
jgi:GMP synthase-like glutamine amidotransferase